MRQLFLLLITFLFQLGCSSDTPEPTITPTPTENLYFPPLTGDVWETQTISSLGWNQTAVQPLLDYIEAKNTKGFIILVNGKIVFEN
jgi:hypothetical protein